MPWIGLKTGRMPYLNITFQCSQGLSTLPSILNVHQFYVQVMNLMPNDWILWQLPYFIHYFIHYFIQLLPSKPVYCLHSFGPCGPVFFHSSPVIFIPSSFGPVFFCWERLPSKPSIFRPFRLLSQLLLKIISHLLAVEERTLSGFSKR